MAVELDVPVQQNEHTWLSWLASRQAFWVFLALVAACIFLHICDQFLRHPQQSVQHHAQFHLCRDHLARHDDRDHHRGHRSFGRLGALPLQHDSGRGHAQRLQHRDRHRRFDRHGAPRRRGQRSADRLCRHSAVRRHARHAVLRPIARDGRLQQHRRFPVRPRSCQASVSRRRRVSVRHFEPGHLYDRAGAHHRLHPALDAIRALRLRHRRKREGGDS